MKETKSLVVEKKVGDIQVRLVDIHRWRESYSGGIEMSSKVEVSRNGEVDNKLFVYRDMDDSKKDYFEYFFSNIEIVEITRQSFTVHAWGKEGGKNINFKLSGELPLESFIVDNESVKELRAGLKKSIMDNYSARIKTSFGSAWVNIKILEKLQYKQDKIIVVEEIFEGAWEWMCFFDAPSSFSRISAWILENSGEWSCVFRDSEYNNFDSFIYPHYMIALRKDKLIISNK